MNISVVTFTSLFNLGGIYSLSKYCKVSVNQSNGHECLFNSYNIAKKLSWQDWKYFSFFSYKVVHCLFSRDRANFQLNNRRLERKVKELMLQVDDEHLSLTDQKDQVEGKTNMLLGIISDICINHHMYEIFQKNIGRYWLFCSLWSSI